MEKELLVLLFLSFIHRFRPNFLPHSRVIGFSHSEFRAYFPALRPAPT